MSSEALQQAKGESGWQAKHVYADGSYLPADRPGNRYLFRGSQSPQCSTTVAKAQPSAPAGPTGAPMPYPR